MTVSASQSARSGTLYVVATPIGNLEDISQRAIRVLGDVDLILAEDTRHSQRLLARVGVDVPTRACHEHNERALVDQLVERLLGGQRMALVSDAGTPLLSDPGFHLVREARAAGITVVPVPGPSALTAALSVAGLPTHRFTFEGFLPAKEGQRRSALEALADESRTMVFFEAPHRITTMLRTAAQVFGGSRNAAYARELTKRFESVVDGTLTELIVRLEAHPEQVRGEFVVLISGAQTRRIAAPVTAETLLLALLAELPASRAAAVAAKVLDAPRKTLYELALRLGEQGS